MRKILLTAALLSAAFGFSQAFVNTDLLTQPKQSGSDCSCAAWINSDLAEAGGNSNESRAADGNAVKLEDLEARGLYQEVAVTANTDYIVTFLYRFSEGSSDTPSDPFINLTVQGTILAGSGYESGYTPVYQVEGVPAGFNSSGYGYTDIINVENTANQLAFESYPDPGNGDLTNVATLTFNSGSNTSIALFIRAIRDGAEVPFESYSWSSGDSEVRIDAITLVEDTSLSSNDFSINGESITAYQPTSGTIAINGIEVDAANVYALNGAVVAKGAQTVDVSTLSTGIYILQVESNGKSTSKTMVVK